MSLLEQMGMFDDEQLRCVAESVNKLENIPRRDAEYADMIVRESIYEFSAFQRKRLMALYHRYLVPRGY